MIEFQGDRDIAFGIFHRPSRDAGKAAGRDGHGDRKARPVELAADDGAALVDLVANRFAVGSDDLDRLPGRKGRIQADRLRGPFGL